MQLSKAMIAYYQKIIAREILLLFIVTQCFDSAANVVIRNKFTFMKKVLLSTVFTSATIFGFSQKVQETSSNCIIPELKEIVSTSPEHFYQTPFKSHCYKKTETSASYSLVEVTGVGWDVYYGGNHLYLFTQNDNNILKDIMRLKNDKRYTLLKQDNSLQLFIDTIHRKFIVIESNEDDSLYISNKYRLRVFVCEEFKLSDYGKDKGNANPLPPIEGDSRSSKNYRVNDNEDAYTVTDAAIKMYRRKLFNSPVFRNAIKPLQYTFGFDKLFYEEENHPAQFPGGTSAWSRYLMLNTKYPETAQRKGTQGIVRVQFIIDNEGYIKEVIALNNPGDGLAEEAIRVIRNAPRWLPALQNGRKVSYRLTQKIPFQLE